MDGDKNGEDGLRQTNRLTALEVKRAIAARAKGKLRDGGGLILLDGRSWVFRIRGRTVASMTSGSARRAT